MIYDGSGNILQTNSLLPPHEWTDEFKTRLAEALHIKKSEIRNHESITFFDVIVTNPPFGSKIPIKDKNILEQFELAHIWENDKKTGIWTITERLQSSAPPEILFIERCSGLIETAYYPGWMQRSRLKRIWCDKSYGEGFYLPSQMTDLYPVPEKHISRLADCDMDELRLKENTLLLTRSGTIGNISYVSKTLQLCKTYSTGLWQLHGLMEARPWSCFY